MNAHGFSITTHTVTFMVLLVLATLSWWASHLKLGAAQVPIALIIAGCKAGLVIAIFMGLARARASIIITMLVATLLIIIFILLVWMDVGLRPRYQLDQHISEPAAPQTSLK